MSSNPPLETSTDQALLDQFGELVQRGHHHTVVLLRHIDVIDRRKLWAKYGHPSLFDFCVSRHHMSESTAAKRIGAARAARRFPVLFEMVARGELHLSGIHRLKAHLTPANHAHVLGHAKYKTLREIDVLIARLAPKPDVPSTLRALPEQRVLAVSTPVVPVPVVATPVVAAPVIGAESPTVGSAPASPALPTATAPVEPQAPQMRLAPPAERRAADPVPLSPGRYKLTVTLDERSHQRLEQLQDLLAHKIPNGDPAAIIERALKALLTEVKKRKTGITDKPRPAKPAPPGGRTRHVQAAVRREVWPADDARCGFIGDGHQCNETRGLEFAHREPWAKGGDNSAGNLTLRCMAHNALEADRDYGTGFMARKRNRNQKPLKVREPLTRYVVRKDPGVQDGARQLKAAPAREKVAAWPPAVAIEILGSASARATPSLAGNTRGSPSPPGARLAHAESA